MSNTAIYTGTSIPELGLRTLWDDAGVSVDVKVALADAGLLMLNLFAATGKDADAAATNSKTIVTTVKKWPTDPAKDIMELIRLRAAWTMASAHVGVLVQAQAKLAEDPTKVPGIGEVDWNAMRSKFVTAHPELLLTQRNEPHRRFIEVLRRDMLLHGRVQYYDLSRVWVRGDGPIGQTQHLHKSMEDLIKQVSVDNPVGVSTQEQVMERITALLYALEYVGVMKLNKDTSFAYLKELQSFSRKNPGFQYLMRMDMTIRTEVEDRLREEDTKDFEKEFKFILDHRKDLWVTVPVELRTAGGRRITPPPKRVAEDGGNGTPPGKRARKTKAERRASAKEKAGKAPENALSSQPAPKGAGKGAPKGAGKGKGDAKGNKRIPDAEFQALVKLPSKNPAGKICCRWWNSSSGCTTALCGFAHECAECGGPHTWAAHHNK